jgi:undecaprenyl-diphosphatase
MLESIKNTEYEWFLWLNGFHTPFFDTLMYWISHRFTFIPLYVFLIYLVFKYIKNQPFQKLAFIILSVGVSDRFTSGFMKPYFQRLRPCHDPIIGKFVHIVDGCGGQYGFVSSHAANSFALVMSFYLLFYHFKKNNSYFKALVFLLFIWAIIVSYSRIYNGVHYPSDILVGGLIGIFITLLFYILFNKLTKNQLKRLN